VSGVFIGLDLGTSAAKAVALRSDGSVRGRTRHTYPTSRPQPGAAEQNPADWWAATMAALSELASVVPAETWQGIGLSAMLPTLVELDRHGAAIGSAVTWEDARAEFEGAKLRERVGADRLYRITGQHVDGRYLAPMHRRRAAAGSETATVVGAKDWLFGQLTGELLTDPSTATGFGVYDLNAAGWDPDLVAAAGVPALPAVAPSDTALPLLPAVCSALGCRSGTPVVLGAADSVLGAYGLGVGSPGEVAVIGGTSTVVIAVSSTSVVDPRQRYLVTPLVDSRYGLEMDMLATGSAISWLADLLGFADSAALTTAAAAVGASEAPLFLPYLAPGEQGALWDPSLTGVLSGLHLGVRREQVARGLITGIVVELSRCVTILEEATGAGGPIRVSGPSASGALMRRDLADATGRPVLSDNSGEVDHSAIGAAAYAAVACTGLRPPVRDDIRTVDPNPSMAAMWAGLVQRHDDALRAAQKHGPCD